MAPVTWDILFRFNPKKDSYKNIYERAQSQIKMAKQFNKKSVPILQKHLNDAKMYFAKKHHEDAKRKMMMKKITHSQAKISNKNLNKFVMTARRK